MPMYALNPGGEVKLPHQPLRCFVRLPNELGSAARVTATVDGSTASHVIQERAESVVIPTVDSDISIQVSPPTGHDRFSAGSIAQLSVLGMRQSTDPDRVNLADTDLSGLGTVELIRISSSEHSLHLRTASLSKHQQLSPLGDAARMITAELLGTNSVADEDQARFVVALDDSASFRRNVESGDTRAAVQILSGVASILAENEQLSLVAPRQHPVPTSELASAGEEAESLLSSRPLATLFETEQIAESLSGLSTSKRAALFVISDSVPADFSQQAVLLSDRASLLSLVLGPGQLVSRLYAGSAAHTVIDTGDGSFTVEQTYLQHLPALRTVVEAIIRTVHPERSN